MSDSGRLFLRPQRTDMKFNLKFGTHVRVFSTTEGIIEGLVFQNSNPTTINGTTFLELCETVRITGYPPTEELESIGFVRLSSEDILSVREIAPRFKPKLKLRTEISCHTLVISTDKGLTRLISMLDDVTEVALNFYGTYVSRDGELGWITLFVGDTLVCIDALELSVTKKDFWTVMNNSLFANEKITKVVYNSRPIVDYLFHKHCILLENVDDLQVSEFVACVTNQFSNVIKQNKSELKYKKLSEMMQVFLEDTVPPEEIDLLIKFEDEDFSKTGPLMTRPLVDETHFCKSIAIEMKYLLRLSTKLREEQLKILKRTTRAQLEEMVIAGNDKMEMQMGYPLRVPDNVVKSCGSLPAMLVMKARSCAIGRNQKNAVNGNNSENTKLD